MIPDRFRTALASKLGEIVTPELAAWLEENAFDRVDHSYNPAQFPSVKYLGLTFRVERLAEIEDEIHPLHEAHWRETEKHRNGHQMLPDYEAFKADENAGRLIQFTARDSAWKLVGNIRMYVYTSRHDRTLEFKEDTFFLLPENRKGFTAIRFWQYMEACMRAIGVQGGYTDSKLVNNVGRLNEYLGYKLVGQTYYKHLGD